MQTFNGRPLDQYDKPDLIRIVELEREAHIQVLEEMKDRLDSIRLATRLVLNQERR